VKFTTRPAFIERADPTPMKSVRYSELVFKPHPKRYMYGKKAKQAVAQLPNGIVVSVVRGGGDFVGHEYLPDAPELFEGHFWHLRRYLYPSTNRH